MQNSVMDTLTAAHPFAAVTVNGCRSRLTLSIYLCSAIGNDSPNKLIQGRRERGSEKDGPWQQHFVRTLLARLAAVFMSRPLFIL